MTLILNEIPYASVFLLTNQIMHSLINQTEETIASEMSKFMKEGPEYFEIELSKEDGIYDQIQFYHGLSDKEVDLEEMFLEFFPSLSRRSVFQTIYGIYEVELLELCRSFHQKLGGKKPDNFKGSGVVKVNNFMSRHYPELETSTQWKLIDQLRVLRNNCIHSDGCVFKKDKPIGSIQSLIDLNNHLFHYDGPINSEGDKYRNGDEKRVGRNIIFEKGSLEYVLEAFKSYVDLVHSLHTKRYV
ncbi:TPA: hypothetical protein ACSPZR_003838 [Aeromonas veronii]